MTPERATALVTAWVRLYTRGLPAPVARRRVEEIAADLHDHVAHARAAGTGETRIALAILSRMTRGVAADTAWRRRTAAASVHAQEPAARRARRRPSAAAVALVAASPLLVPALAMALTDEVAWGPVDFALAGVLLVGTALALRTVIVHVRDIAHRSAVGLTLGAALLLIWATLGVGIIGEPGEGANAMYAGVLGVAVAGALLARGRPRGMARAMLATATAQAGAAAIALVLGAQDRPGASVAEILALNGMFVALFLGAAGLFAGAARRRSQGARA